MDLGQTNQLACLISVFLMFTVVVLLPVKLLQG